MIRNDRLLSLAFGLFFCFSSFADKLQETGTNNISIPEERKEIRALLATGKFDEALVFAQRWVATNEMRFGKESAEAAQSLFSLAGATYCRGDLIDAVALYERCLGIRERVLPPDQPDIADTLFILANLHFTLGNHSKAELLMRRCLQFRERILGPEHPDTADTLQGLGILYRTAGNYTKAEPLYLRSLKIREKVLGSEHPDTAESLQSLGNLYWDVGDYTKAEPLYQRSLKIREKVLGPEHPETAVTLNSLAILYQTIGDYAKAEPLYQQSLKIREKVWGADNYETADSVQSLGILYQVMGDYTKAEPLYLRSLKIREKVLGPEHPDTADSLQSLGNLYWDMCDYTKAEPLYLRSLNIREKVLGLEHPDTAATLNNLGSLYSAAGDYAKAEPLYQRSLKIREKVLGEEHFDTSVTLNNLASLYFAKGDFEKAEPLYVRSLYIREKVLGSEHPDTAQILQRIAELFIETQQPTLALDYARREQKASQHALANILAFTSEQQRTAYQTKHQPCNVLATLGSAPDLFLTVLHNKGIVLDSMLEDTLVAENSTNAAVQKLVADLRSSGQQLIKLQTTVSTNCSPDAIKLRQEKQSAMENRVEELQKNLARNVAAAGQTRRALNLTVSEVQDVLEKDTVLLEFIRYHPVVKGKSLPLYGVILIGGGAVAFKDAKPGELVWVPLGLAETIDQSLMEFRAVMRQGNDGKASLLKKLYTLLFDPIQQSLPQGIRTLIISPDAELNFINLATLLDGQDKFLAEKFTIKYVSSGRDLVFGQKAGKGNRRLSAFANPAFDMKPKLAQASDTNRLQLAMPVKDQRDYNGLNLPPLPGTEKEAVYLLDKCDGWKLEGAVFKGAEASETEVRAVKSPYILHLATHGFFLSDTESTNRPNLKTHVVEESSLPIVWHNPMQRSGLAFAGAQLTLDAWKRGETPDPENDGILTAQEVGTMDLHNTWLVTLSACDTGTGEARAGEGVMGLRRGFVQAGAQNLLMTLWPVSDRRTVEFMEAFYQKALKTGDAPGALAEVQRDMLVKIRSEKGALAAARYAGPFIMTFQGHP